MPPASVVLAFDIGGTSVKAAALQTDLTPLAHTRQPSRCGPAILDVVAQCAEDLLEQLDASSTVVAAGVIVPGIVDAAAGVCRRSVNLDLTDLDLATPLRHRLGVPVAVGHDVATAAHAVRRRSDTVDPYVVVWGTGIAGVAYVDGEPVTGISGQAGEIGHLVVRPDGPTCGCGARGCVEAIAGAAALLRHYAHRSGNELDDVRELVAAIPHDPVAAQVWDDAVEALCCGLSAVNALLAPGAILLAGGLAEAGDTLTVAINARLQDAARVTACPPVLVSELGGSAGVVGAAELALGLLADVSP